MTQTHEELENQIASLKTEIDELIDDKKDLEGQLERLSVKDDKTLDDFPNSDIISHLKDELDEEEIRDAFDLSNEGFPMSELYDHEKTFSLGSAIEATSLSETMVLDSLAKLCHKIKSPQKIAALLDALAA